MANRRQRMLKLMSEADGLVSDIWRGHGRLQKLEQVVIEIEALHKAKHVPNQEVEFERAKAELLRSMLNALKPTPPTPPKESE